MIKNLPEDQTKSEEEIKQKALIDNTAQEIFNNLKGIENQRKTYEKCWIWELMQNALDAAPPDRKIEVEIIKNDTQITFRHNGRPFKPEEVAHLIYHGSTKKEEDIGKFGTGFITTHLLSKKVIVNGVREDHKSFRFELDREGNSPDEIKNNMEETWKTYQESLGDIQSASTSYPAEYEYSLNNIALNTVEAGIEDLTKIAPYVLAFNDKLESIKITEQDREIKFELVNESNETACAHKTVKQKEEGQIAIEHELWIIKNEDVEVAIKGIKQNDGTCQIESLQDIPKIFLAFPLFGTRDLPFPAVINSRRFKPTKERDGIFLGEEDTDDVKQNKRLLEKANELFINLISNSDSNKFKNLHNLLKFGCPPEGLDKDWYNGLLRTCIEGILKSRVLRTEIGTLINLDESFIPKLNSLEEEKIKRFWDLCYNFLDYKDKLPAKILVFEWMQIINGWESLGLDLITEIEITIEKVATLIDDCGNLKDLKAKLNSDINELDTLDAFYELLLEAGKRELFDNKNILPDQNGVLTIKSQLLKDEGIDEVLKDISEKLSIGVRSQLLHLKVSENIQNLHTAKKQEQVLDQITNKIKQPHPEDEFYAQANIDLFSWLLDCDKLEYFEGYPILSLKEKIYTQLKKQDSEKLLAPKNVWHETAQVYADIFPQDFIISSAYFEKISQKEKWNKLEEKGFLLTNPLYNESETIKQNELDSFLFEETIKEDEEVEEHELTVELSKISFLDTKDKGILDTVRGSREKARKFLRFLFDYVIEVDADWNTPQEINCKCDSQHKIIPSAWLSKLKERFWVPVRRGKYDKPNTQIIAALIKDDKELIEKCRQDKPSKLLSKLNISISGLMMQIAAENDSIKNELDRAVGSLFSTFMTNPSQLSKIAELAESEPGLFIEKMEERIQIIEQIRKNQAMGALVENLLKSVLEKEGFQVERTRVGSDFVVEHDFVNDNMETVFEIKKEKVTCSYIELKSTTQDFVKMTLTQAKEARDKPDNHVLCVIELNDLHPNEESIKKSAKFVTDIGNKVQNKVDEAENLKDEQEKIAISGDIEIEISEGPIRIKINKPIWKDSKTLDQFFTFLRV